MKLPDEARPFPGTEKAVNQALLDANIPKDVSMAVIASADTEKFLVAARIRKGDWSFAGYLEKEWDKPIEAGASVVWYPH